VISGAKIVCKHSLRWSAVIQPAYRWFNAPRSSKRARQLAPAAGLGAFGRDTGLPGKAAQRAIYWVQRLPKRTSGELVKRH
jgi:hypothetical protein